jgi:hypothetical protein
MPLKSAYGEKKVETRVITESDRKGSAYEKLRSLYGAARHVGKGKKTEEK